ncbi:MAG: UvrD-helicase domain-containing protein [Flavobacteriales bacterium]|nr:UvrD-helicase domain-containing protein [Flavobacteriales bacterium]
MPSELITLDKYSELNPVREHIELAFEKKDEEAALDAILNDLKACLSVVHSRALVFCHSRSATEEGAQRALDAFASAPELKGRCTQFHAGMDAEARAYALDRFRNGEVLVLFATKAFGMGMDIKNIHHVYHLGPSTTFEDYLQEVGRAGRDPRSLAEAGFRDGKRIRALCLASDASFKQAQDRVQKEQIGWSDISNAFVIFKRYQQRFKGLAVAQTSDEYLPIPLNILSTSAQYRDRDKEPAGLYRIALYWLDQAARVRSRYLMPAFLEFKNDPFFLSDVSEKIADDQERNLYQFVLYERTQRFADQQSTLVDGAVLHKHLALSGRDELFQLIWKAQERGHLALVNEVRIEITGQGRDEIELRKQSRTSHLFVLDAVRRMAGVLLSACTTYTPYEPDPEWLESEWKQVVEVIFIEGYPITGSDENGQRHKYVTTPSIRTLKTNDRSFKQWLVGLSPTEEADMKRQRRLAKNALAKLKCAFTMLTAEDTATCSSVITDHADVVIQRIVLRKSKDDAMKAMEAAARRTIALFDALVAGQGPVKDLGEVLIKARLHDLPFSEIERAFILLRKLGYVRFQGGLVPMAIEVGIRDAAPLGDKPNDTAVRSSFRNSIRSKKLRLLVLQAFAQLTDRDEQNKFILAYFKCASSDEVIDLLERSLPEKLANELLAGFREEALTKEVEGLNAEQRAVYDADINKNLSVVAGPGTGKTHTLVLRVARLIQQEHIAPQRILVLAYNRAVVEELKLRLKRLFVSLGYHSLTRSLKVYTFHGLMAAVLKRNGIANTPLDELDNAFTRLMKEQGRAALKEFREMEYVLVDEFQDITDHRLAILKTVAPPEHVRVSVIGDPNQSIYGYERGKEGGSTSPEPYYAKFNRLFEPDVLKLVQNYRSTQAIIDAAVAVLPESDRDLVLEGHRQEPEGGSIRKVQEADWLTALSELLRMEGTSQVAVLFRTNAELWSTQPAIKQICTRPGFRVRIKGGSAAYVKRREVAAVLDRIRSTPDDANLSIKIQKDKDRFQKWDHALMDEVMSALKYYRENHVDTGDGADFGSFLHDLTGREDGQLEELLQRYLGRQPEKEVILSTMHKVKGLEFQNVVVAPTASSVPMGSYSTELFNEAIDEERRIRYVALSRAKERVVVVDGEREAALLAGTSYPGRPHESGILFKPEDECIMISWKANDELDQRIHAHIRDNVAIGDRLRLVHEGQGWYITHNGVAVERLTDKSTDRLEVNPSYTGLFVSDIVRYTKEECIAYDEKKNAAFYARWCDDAKKRGFIYLVHFHGQLISE